MLVVVFILVVAGAAFIGMVADGGGTKRRSGFMPGSFDSNWGPSDFSSGSNNGGSCDGGGFGGGDGGCGGS
ncbi:hypothetical protein [Bacillus sp. T33-2]|uniref:hypothetical protein n=1 Tax=Bacillus sp. T33-2 TaxID=2054168 RepID=UPI000C75D592|nr:hypothetical protein [Bacillus sp. T33-2]PLR94158.1 hypothetical protein CVD19_17920 [Bacillus sp. T33-2]